MNGQGRYFGARFTRAVVVVLIGAVVGLSAMVGSVDPARAAITFTVNSRFDQPDANLADPSCKSTVSTCTLRAAIMQANFSGADNIFFAIPGGGVQTIFPGSGAPGPLPSLTDSVVIDGTTQPGYAGTPLIEVNGSSAGLGANGIALVSIGNTVKGLAIHRFNFAGIHVAPGSTGNTIVSNHVGTDATGVAGIPNGTGIALYGSSNTVGAVGAGNLISGNLNSGVLIDASSGNVLRANRIGTDAAGSAPLGNDIGVNIRNGASTTKVGGDYTLGESNIISGNTSYGVSLDGVTTWFNLVAGNGIGTNATGSGAIPNGTGVYLSGGANSNEIGCGTLTIFGCSSPNYGNLISGNSTEGVHITSAATNVLAGNGIGVNLAGTAAIPNGGRGVLIDGGASGNIMGGGGGAPGGDRNYISGNSTGGIAINGVGATGNVVLGNYIGTDALGTAAIGNNGEGVLIYGGASGNGVGDGTAAGRNVISGNLSPGIDIVNPGTNNNTIRGNYIGVDASGTSVIGNYSTGVGVFDGDANSIGGPSAADGNVISGHPCNVCVSGPATNTAITNNLIGTNATGTATFGGSFYGIEVSGEPSGTTAINGNTIGGNGIGLYVTGSNGGGAIQASNTIGTDATGALALGNTGAGVYVDGGSTNWLFRYNKIAYNAGNGVGIAGPTTSGIEVLANEIHDNGGLGIDLNNDGVTANDAKDPDAGPNSFQNKPVLIAASDAGGGTAVSLTFNGEPLKQFTIHLYSNAACDLPDAVGEGGTFLEYVGADTDANGDATVGFVTTTAAPVGSKLTALAEENSATPSTSEFSNCVSVAPACAGDIDCDGVSDATPDNCFFYVNPSQANGDSGPPPPAGRTGQIDNGTGIVANDTTVPNGDHEGDPCDSDRDNDGLYDIWDTEPLLGVGTCAAFVGAIDGHSNPAVGDVTDVDGNGPSWDTDKDAVLDGVECALGFNPRSAASKPSQAQCANYHTGGVGSKTATTDLDNDGLPAYDEYCKWGTEDDPAYSGLPLAQDFDADGKKDCVEANDTNGDGVQNFPGDTVNSAKAANNLIQKTLDFDLNGDSVVNFPGDTVLSARMVNHVGGICP